MIQVKRLHRAAPALGALLVATSACGGPPPKHSSPPVIVQTTTVQRRTIATFETLDGEVDPYLQASLAPQQSGTLVQIYANEGDRVRKGETLAKIDDSTLQANLVQQEGNQTQAGAKLSQSRIQLPITSTQYQAALVEAKRSLAEADKLIIADRANVTNTKATYDGDFQLYGQGFVAKTALEAARSAYVAALQTLRSDEDKVVQSEAALAQAKQDLLNTPLQQQVITENQGAVVQAAGSVQQYRTAITQTVLTAPFDGVVTSRTLDPGGYASPSQAIYQISQIDPVYVDFNVKDTDLAYVREGTLVSFTASSQPNRRFTGSVFSVNAVPENGTLLYRARIVERNPDFALRGGVLVSVRVTLQNHPDVLSVPRQAIVIDGNRGTLYTLHKGSDLTAHALHVRVGLATNDYIEVSGAGLEPGETIVAAQPDTIREGARLVVANK
jgi:HlyD family secretion protein